MRVAVIGGGYAGMAAAVELARHDVPVTVFESAPVLGGRARCVERNDAVLDNGLHILLGAYTETLRLIRLVNANHAAALLRMPLEWRVHNEFHLRAAQLPAPLHLLAALLRASGAGFGERFQAARFLARMRRNGYRLDADETVEQLFADNAQGPRLTQMLWRPLCLAALNTPPELASAQVFLNVLRDSLGAGREASDLVLARVDLTALFPEPAAAYVERHGGRVWKGRRVTAIDAGDGAFAVESAREREKFSHVVCALPPHQAGAFLIGITALAEIAETIERLRYQTIHSIWLQYPASVQLPSPMLGFNGSVVHWAFDREALCGQRGLIGAVISSRGMHEDLPHEELARQAHFELDRQLGGLPQPSWHQVIAEKRATFSCEPGLRRPPQVTPLRNFFLAGDYTESDYPATIEAAVRSGVACAREILRLRQQTTNGHE